MVPTKNYLNAKEFLDALDISTDRWLPNSQWNSPWVFRGQRNSEWGLVPAAWRKNSTPEMQRLETLKRRFKQEKPLAIKECFSKIKKDHTQSELAQLIDAYAQARAEFQLIMEFILFADELGHPVPGSEIYLRLSNYDYIPDLRKYPLVRLLPEPNATAALAQHHGIPTRAIDWTNNPLVSAFFAAEGVSCDDDDGCIAVWAIRHDLLRKYGGDQIQKREYCQFKVLKCPRSDNLYLHAQEGLFIFPIYGCAYFAKNGCWPTLEEFAIDISQSANEDVIRKFVLPNAQVGELLRLLWARGISRGHLMPTYDNVTKSLLTKWEWWDF